MTLSYMPPDKSAAEPLSGAHESPTDDERAASLEAQAHTLRERAVLEWGGLHIDMPVLRLFASFWISVLIAVGCIWIILAPTNQSTTNAASALLGALVSGWVAWMARNQ
jgi:hypothetical protein